MERRGKVPVGLREVALLLDDVNAFAQHTYTTLCAVKIASEPIVDDAGLSFDEWKAANRIGESPDAASQKKDFAKVLRRVGLARTLLCGWFEAWLSADRDTAKFLDCHPEVKSHLENYVKKHRLAAVWAVSGPSMTAVPRSIKAESTAIGMAARMFLTAVTHPECGRIAQCDRPRCKRVYISTQSRMNKRYCSRKCGAANSRRSPAQLERKRKLLEKAKDTLQRIPGHERKDWQRWLNAMTKISLNQISRWESAGQFKKGGKA